MSLKLSVLYPPLQNFVRAISTSSGRVCKTAVVPQNSSSSLVIDENYDKNRQAIEYREAWVETLDSSAPGPQSLIELHPKIFAAFPRLDIIHENVVWQHKYRMVNYAHTKHRSEVRGGGKKPWPQKGTGRARHGSIRSPLWKGGGVVHGPRAFTTQFYMLPFSKRVLGLISTLSAKFAQDDIKIVENLDMPSDDAGYIEKLCEDRYWGPSVLFIDDADLMPRNITLATDSIQHINLMPVYGLNTYSMLKHETLVLTVDAVRRIEERLLYQLNRPDGRTVGVKFRHR